MNPASYPVQVKDLDDIIRKACEDPNAIPGATVVVVDKAGNELFAKAVGRRGCESEEPMTLDSIYWLASCTKLLTAIACMQLVEQDRIKLDDVGELETICPELKAVKVLRDDGLLEEKKQGITLRMLLTHTAGFGYSFFNKKLRNHGFPIGFEEFSGDKFDMLQPLVNQPGETWEYGINLDWAGVVVERVSQLRLNAYLQNFVFRPLGLDNISFLPTQEMKAKLACIQYRDANGGLSQGEHVLRRPLVLDPSEVDSLFHSGGAGCFAKPQEYCQILASLLNNGTSPRTGLRILQPSTVDEMFANQIPQLPNFGRVPVTATKRHYCNDIEELFPQDRAQPQGWGISFMLTLQPHPIGRGANTAHWAGLPNLWWWCDRSKGVAGMVCTQILPSSDPKVNQLIADVESAVYRSLFG